MTPEEKEVLKERIKNAENLERRIGNLQDARDKLQEKEISGLKFIFNEEDSGLLQVFYKNHGDEKFYRICWLDGGKATSQQSCWTRSLISLTTG